MEHVNQSDIPIHIEESNEPTDEPKPSTSQDVSESFSESDTDSDDVEATAPGVKITKRYLRKDTSKLLPHLKGLMGEANLRYARGDLETSKRMCFEVIRQCPDAYEPYLTLAQMYETSNIKKYKGYIILANHLEPTNISLWCRLADVYLQEGNLLEAIRCYSKGIKHEPKNMFLHKKRLELLEQRGDSKFAFMCKQTMAKHVPKRQHETIINLVMDIAKEHFKMKNYIRAVEALSIPLKRVPQHVTKDLINMMLEVLLHSERYSACLDIFTQFCGFTFDITITEEQSLIVNSYTMPENLQVDLKVKFIACLVRLRSTDLIPNLINNVLMEDDVEVVGDLYLDVVEALMQTGYPGEAIKLLVPMVKSKNYSLAAVWLKYAECLTTCHMPEQAIEAYFTVMAMAPSHVEVLYPLAMLLLQQNKKQEALEVLSQDLTTNKLDVAVLLEQMKLLRQIGDWDSYWKSVELLLSRHCVVLRNPEELKIVLTHQTVREKITKIKKMRHIRSQDTEVERNFISIREPSVEEEYEIYKGILQVARERREYVQLQKFAFMGMCSKRFTKYFDEMLLFAFYSCVFTKDVYHGYTIARELLIRRSDVNLCWNWFSLVIQMPDDVRQGKFLERYQDKLTGLNREQILANYDLGVSNFVSALNHFTKQFKQTRSEFAAFMMGIALLQVYCQRNTDRSKKKLIAETITYLFLNYAKLRGKSAEQEIYYNLGRMYHQLGIAYLAEHYYKKVFTVSNELLEKHPEVLCLKREAAFNLHLIYRSSGNMVAARNILLKHIVI